MNINFVKFSPFLQPYLCLSWVLGEEVRGVFSILLNVCCHVNCLVLIFVFVTLSFKLKSRVYISLSLTYQTPYVKICNLRYLEYYDWRFEIEEQGTKRKIAVSHPIQFAPTDFATQNAFWSFCFDFASTFFELQGQGQWIKDLQVNKFC